MYEIHPFDGDAYRVPAQLPYGSLLGNSVFGQGGQGGPPGPTPPNFQDFGSSYTYSNTKGYCYALPSAIENGPPMGTVADGKYFIEIRGSNLR